jgi:hypothetical protein
VPENSDMSAERVLTAKKLPDFRNQYTLDEASEL